MADRVWFVNTNHYGIEGVIDGENVLVKAVSDVGKPRYGSKSPKVGSITKGLKHASGTFIYKLRSDPCPPVQPVAPGDDVVVHVRVHSFVPFRSLDEFMSGEWYKKPQSQVQIDESSIFASDRDMELANVKVSKPLMGLIAGDESCYEELASVVKLQGLLPLSVIKYLCWQIGQPPPGVRICPYAFVPDLVNRSNADAALYYKLVRGETHCQLTNDGSVVLKLVDDVWKDGYIKLWNPEDFAKLPQDKWANKDHVVQVQTWLTGDGDPQDVGLPADTKPDDLRFIVDPKDQGKCHDKVIEATEMRWFHQLWCHRSTLAFDDARKAYELGLDVPDSYSKGGLTLIRELQSVPLLEIEKWKDLLLVATPEEVDHMKLTSFKVLNEATDYELTCSGLYNAAMGSDSKRVITALKEMNDDELDLLDFLRPNKVVFEEFDFEMIANAVSQTDTSAPMQKPCPIKDIKQFLEQAKKLKPILDLVRKQVAKVLKEEDLETEMCHWYISTNVNTRFPQVSRLEALEIINTGGFSH